MGFCVINPPSPFSTLQKKKTLAPFRAPSTNEETRLLRKQTRPQLSRFHVNVPTHQSNRRPPVPTAASTAAANTRPAKSAIPD
jgi:hypothetical protein